MINNGELVQNVIDGLEDPLKAYALLLDQKTYIEKCIKEIKEGALQEAQKYDKTFELHGYKFESKKGGAYYDYSTIPDIKEAERNLKELKQEAIARTKTVHDCLSEDGEILPKPIVKYKADSLSVKFVK